MVKINAISQAHLIKLMLEGTYTCAELAEQTGLHYVTVLHYTRELHRAGAAHICMWEKDARGRDLLKVYKIGAGVDAKRKRMTSAERQKRYRDRMKQGLVNHVLAGNGGFERSANGKVVYRESK